jgi:hypothetical protein
MTKLGVVIQWCGNEQMFADAQRRELLKAVPEENIVCTQFDSYFDGTPDTATPPFTRLSLPLTKNPVMLLHRRARISGLSELPGDCTHVMFLDGDEIIEGEKLAELQLPERPLRLRSEWYWHSATNQAVQQKECAALVTPMMFINFKDLQNDRKGLTVPMATKEVSDKPMCHHYSWVGDKARILRKVQTWWHKKDFPGIEERIEREWDAGPPDFIHSYSFRTVANQFGLA